MSFFQRTKNTDRLSGAWSCFLSVFLFAPMAVDAGGVIPVVTSGDGNNQWKLFSTPDEGCKFQWDYYRAKGTIGDGPYQKFLRPYVKSWRGTGGTGTWYDSVLPYNTPLLGGWLCHAEYEYTDPFTGAKSIKYWGLNWMYPVCPTSFAPGSYPYGQASTGPTYCPAVPNYYVIGKPNKNLGENGSCKNFCGDPINPASGNVFDRVPDLTASNTDWQRFYNSQDNKTGFDAAGWRGSYSRTIKPNLYASSYQAISSAGSVTSSLYNDESSACTSGFAQIKSQIPEWSGAVSSYSNGVCNLTKNGISIGTLPIYSSYGFNLAPEAAPTGYDYIRDDGAVVRFSVIGDVIAAPPGTALKLSQTNTGFTIADGADNIEQYDTRGKLLSITSRGGMVQTMNYDGAGRLSGVTDSFGHQLIFSYDANGKLSSVTRQ